MMSKVDYQNRGSVNSHFSFISVCVRSEPICVFLPFKAQWLIRSVPSHHRERQVGCTRTSDKLRSQTSSFPRPRFKVVLLTHGLHNSTLSNTSSDGELSLMQPIHYTENISNSENCFQFAQCFIANVNFSMKDLSKRTTHIKVNLKYNGHTNRVA